MGKNQKVNFIFLFLFVSSFFGILWALLWNYGFKDFYQILYFPSFVTFRHIRFYGYDLSLYFYLIFFVIICFFSFFRKKMSIRLSSLMITTAFIMYFVITTWQMIGQGSFLKNMMNIYSQKTLSEKYLASSFAIRNAYIYSQLAKKEIQGRHSAKLITDMDTSREPGMFMHRTLSYFLYPSFDIRGIRGREENPAFLIIYEKDDIFDISLDGYEIIKVFTERHAIAKKMEKEK